MDTRKQVERDVVWGLFTDQEAASAALEALIDRHFDPKEDISVVLGRGPGAADETRDVDDELEYVEGAKIGGGIGALLGATLVGSGLIGGPAGLIAAGPIVGMLKGAVAGGAFGTFSGWLVSSGIVSPDTDFEDADLDRGAVWIAVHAVGDREDEALAVLREAKAETVSIR